ncbi:MAG: hypothetical protein CVT70_17715 [Alphaproteobacteria bacterium HGW-Alphaproteobacteria-1]|jgi:hypothetical protein|nr:MAG: hypothetical protein CVT70_17715 [Alphaproteobacteria bacterium HGW-Alphaproteobacteria-1]
MTDENDMRAKHKIAAAARRQRDLNQIARLIKGEALKHLEGETRLKAALFIRSSYQELLKPRGPYSMTEIKERLEAELGRANEFKIHRWMLRKTETHVTKSLTDHYKTRAEPQKKTSGYLKLTAALAKIAGTDPDDAMISFMQQTGLSDRLAQRGGLVANEALDPRLGLADLLREFAAHVAERHDLARLFDAAERLQAGWNPDQGPIALLLWDGGDRFTRQTALDGFWLVDSLPPFPSVCLARVPFGHVNNAGFDLRDDSESVSSGTATIHARGSATASWRLHLAIVPAPGGGVIPCFLRTTNLTVYLESVEGSLDHNGIFDVSHHEDDLFELVPGYRDRATIFLDGTKRVAFDEATTKRVEDPQAYKDLYRHRKDRRNTDDEMPPHEGIPVAHLTPVSPAAIQHWLLDVPDFAGATVEPEPILSEYSAWYDPELATWMRGPSLARDLEVALRRDVLFDEFSKWITDYSRSLSLLDGDYRARVIKADLDLHSRWRATSLATSSSATS